MPHFQLVRERGRGKGSGAGRYCSWSTSQARPENALILAPSKGELHVALALGRLPLFWTRVNTESFVCRRPGTVAAAAMEAAAGTMESQSNGGGASAQCDSYAEPGGQKARSSGKKWTWSLTPLVMLSGTLLLLLRYWSQRRADLYSKMQLPMALPQFLGAMTLSSSPVPLPDKYAWRRWNPAAGVNETALALAAIHRNGTTECHRQRTTGSLLFLREDGADGAGVRAAAPVTGLAPVRLAAGRTHQLDLVSVAADGRARCAGGDFYEVDLAGPRWRSRPPTQDMGDGSYRLEVRVDDAQAVNLTVVLLFDAFHGLDAKCARWVVKRRTLFLQLLFFAPPAGAARGPAAPPLALCAWERGDFEAPRWSGRWTRSSDSEAADSCAADALGRFGHCVSPAHQNCNSSSSSDGSSASRVLCQGRVSRLESLGWVYSRPHCGFRIFEAQEAWDLVAGKWLLFWGDSNFQDTIRNLLLFALDYPVPQRTGTTLANWQIPRTVEDFFVNPARPDQAVHVTLIFNGHFNPNGNNLGLDCLLNDPYREWIARHFQGRLAVPDVVVMTAGLHDGVHFAKLDAFAGAAARAARLWAGVWAGLAPERRPRLLFKTAVAPAGESRQMDSNPHKMEVFNGVMVQSLVDELPPGVVGVLDAFDLTFPWHYDNNYSDGGHYGRAPLVNLKPWYGKPHHYFVDVMLAQILLNAIQ